MFSPFCDASGNPKGITEIAWGDLARLESLDEGFVLEFKRDFELWGVFWFLRLVFSRRS